jgi:hypothetical protein
VFGDVADAVVAVAAAVHPVEGLVEVRQRHDTPTSHPFDAVFVHFINLFLIRLLLAPRIAQPRVHHAIMQSNVRNAEVHVALRL